MPLMQILMVCRRYEPHKGGVEKHVARVSDELLKRGYEVVVVTEQHESSLSHEEMMDGVKVVRIPFGYGESKLKMWSWIWEQRRIFTQADVVQVHDVWWWLVPIWSGIRQKLYLTQHGYEGSDLPSVKSILWHRMAALGSKQLMCIGDFQKKWYGVKPDVVSYGATDNRKQKAGNSKQVPVNSYQIAESREQYAEGQGQGTDIGLQKRERQQEPEKLVFVGRLEADTGIREYLRALVLLQQKGRDMVMDVYGEGELREELEKIITQHKLQVDLKGYVVDVSRKLSDYSLACVSQNMAILEALHASVPVVAYADNALKYDYLKMAPYSEWVRIGRSVEELALSLMDTPAVVQEAREWARKQTWNCVVDEYEGMWKA